jgi:hypothetical protein
MELIVSGARSLLYTSGLPATTFWHHAIEHRAYLQNQMALPGRCTPHEMATGKQPDLTYLRTFGCEVMAYVERTKRSKCEPKAERCINLGQSPTHSNGTYKLWNIASGKVIYRRNVALNERVFPGRNIQIITTRLKKDTGEDLIGHDFLEEGDRYTITGTSTNDGVLTTTYQS